MGESTKITFRAVQELSGGLLVAREMIWEAPWFPGEHSDELFGYSGELFGPPGSPLEWTSTLCRASAVNDG